MYKSGLDFQAIYSDFQAKILRYLTHMVGENEAKDLTQEVFVKVSRSLATFRGDCNLSTWIYRIATHAAIDKMRGASYKLETSLAETDNSKDVEDQGAWIGDETPSSEQILMQKEMYQCFMGYVNELPVNYRAIIVLSEIDGFTNNEIAEILGLSLNIVKIRLHRGKTKLIQELKGHCKAEDWL